MDRRSLLSLLLLSPLAQGGCGNRAPAGPSGSTAGGTPGGAGDSAGGVRIGYVLHGLNDFTQVIKKGAEDAGRALGVAVEVTGPAGFVSTDAIAMFEGMAQKRKDGLVVVPQPGDVWVRPIKEATDAGIPVVTANVTSPGSSAAAWFGQDEYESGVLLAHEMREALRKADRKEGRIVV